MLCVCRGTPFFMCASLFFFIFNVSSSFSLTHTNEFRRLFCLPPPVKVKVSLSFAAAGYISIVGNTFFFGILFYFCLQQLELDAMNLNIYIATHSAIATRLFGKKKRHTIYQKRSWIYIVYRARLNIINVNRDFFPTYGDASAILAILFLKDKEIKKKRNVLSKLDEWLGR